MGRSITIKEKAFKEVRNLETKGFKLGANYEILGITNGMILIFNPRNGEIAELFPKYCLVQG